MAAFGVGGYVLVCLYFVFGSAVTKIKLEQKQAEGIAEARGGRRGVGSVWGSGIAGILCAVFAIAGVGPGVDLWRLGFVASFCSKLSDTTASEVGKAYGRTTYMSTPPFKPVPRGTEGAVSLEGTVAGIGASLFFAGVAAAFSIGEAAAKAATGRDDVVPAICGGASAGLAVGLRQKTFGHMMALTVGFATLTGVLHVAHGSFVQDPDAQHKRLYGVRTEVAPVPEGAPRPQ